MDDKTVNQSLSANSAYFTTSECKAKLMTLYSQSQPDSLNGISNLHQKKVNIQRPLLQKKKAYHNRKYVVFITVTFHVCVVSKLNLLIDEYFLTSLSPSLKDYK